MDVSNTLRGSADVSTANARTPILATHIPSVALRAAEKADVDPMHDLVRAAYSPYIPALGYPPPPMRKDYAEILGGHPVWVAVDPSGVVGLLELIVEADYVMVENLAVAPTYQDRKLGRWLMDFAETEARRLGVRANSCCSTALNFSPGWARLP